MPESFFPFDDFIKRFTAHQLTPEELDEFFIMLEERPEFREKYSAFIDADLLTTAYEEWKDKRQADNLYHRITTAANISNDEEGEQKVILNKHTYSLRRSLFRWAAVFLLVASAAFYYFLQADRSTPAGVKQNMVQQNDQVLPGSNKAVLTLASGKKIELNDSSGTIVDGNLSVQHQQGRLSYAASEVFSINTMTTPTGGQYQLTLADGTKVWLNAASSITFPTAFPGTTREVSITGEAYFEVTKNARKPFIVNFDKQRVQVLGTSFNINSYPEENASRTTLVEGSVKISRNGQELTLRPNQQAVANEKLVVNTSPDVLQVLAWKNGTFNFNGQDFAASMRQLERWYEIKVVYDSEKPTEKFGGEIDRNMTLNQALKVLDGIVARFRLEGKVLHVLPMP